jgi:uncharacterized protein YcbK (DUF882 family)
VGGMAVAGDLSEHFSRREFACKGCRGDCQISQPAPAPRLVSVLEAVRRQYGRAVHVTSGYRCEAYNSRIGGAASSQHLVAAAADIIVQGVPAGEVYEWMDKWHFGGLGQYKTFTHVDVRQARVRWAAPQ